jgi:FKBP-type peptidyl-prolyl cis-trans isomerase 2
LTLIREFLIRAFISLENFVIENGNKVEIEYTVFLENGVEIDSNIGDDPLVFVHGKSQVFPALEEAVEGLEVGDSKKFILSPDDAYGPIVKEGFREVQLETVPVEFRFVGAIVGVQDPEGTRTG